MSNFMEISSTLDQFQYQQKIRLIYKCFASWIEEKLVDPNLIVNSKLFMHMFQILVRKSLVFIVVFF